MKLLLTGDWHLRIKPPANRLGDFFQNQIMKLEFILDTAVEHECKYILQPGDLGDRANWQDFLKQYIIELLKHYGVEVLTVLGQHDMKYHALSSLEKTSIKVLEASGVLNILNSVMPHDENSNVHIYGCSYGMKVEEVEDQNAFNVLVIHRMIIRSHGDKLWPSQEHYALPSGFLAKYKDFDLVVSGDNHTGFIVENEHDQVLVNCGALMRAEASQAMFDHKPFVVVFDTDDGSYKQIFIPCKPADEVLDRSKIEQTAERDEKLEAFISGLTGEYDVSLDFRQNLYEFLIVNKIGNEVKEILEGVLDG
jgi:DNA repair exonuclease SbcCD nuclease subunit